MTPSRIVPIADPRDPRIEAYRDIRERDLARAGELIAEGAVVLDELLGSPRFETRSILLLRNRVEGLAQRLARVPAAVPVYVAERAVFDAIAGFPVHRGVMAHAVRRADSEPPRWTELAARGALVVAAFGLSNHDNMGSLFRNAAAFGADAVALDTASCDPLYRKAIRVSVGASLRVPFSRLPFGEEGAAELQRAGFRLAALSPRGSTRLADWRPAGATALLVGAEGEGLPDGVLARSETLRIDMAAGFDSLNVSTAAAVALYCASLARGPRG